MAYPETVARVIRLRAQLESELLAAEAEVAREVALLKIIHEGRTGDGALSARTVELTTAQTVGFLSKYLPDLSAALASG
jgi:hypothetical protein